MKSTLAGLVAVLLLALAIGGVAYKSLSQYVTTYELVSQQDGGR